ncbi:hypothetical protein BCR42DRAFT_497062 [Absidia repens]|uniref:Helicase C-terminal domain-containing protein n=1 Tax=Absidia repens TaxID=90262 RepID=A0A1X2HYK3_9FUNG|nr:hypothetical protein BCR42DRAFT_497062 [Absidia repens]
MGWGVDQGLFGGSVIVCLSCDWSLILSRKEPKANENIRFGGDAEAVGQQHQQQDDAVPDNLKWTNFMTTRLLTRFMMQVRVVILNAISGAHLTVLSVCGGTLYGYQTSVFCQVNDLMVGYAWSCLMAVASKKDMLNVLDKIKQHTAVLHGGITQLSREITMKARRLREGKWKCNCVPMSQSCGLDIPQVDLVIINCHPPKNTESYMCSALVVQVSQGVCVCVTSYDGVYLADCARIDCSYPIARVAWS